MNQHTYQPGDRVTIKNLGRTKATVSRQDEFLKWWFLRRDDLGGAEGPHPLKEGFHFFHDTDIKPGDWVRHESVNGEFQDCDGWEFQVEAISDVCPEIVDATRETYQGSMTDAYVCNVVKIAPPQQEEPVSQAKLVTIRHAKFGTVTRVVWRPNDGCWRALVDGVECYYYPRLGWSEVPQKRDVTGTNWTVDGLDRRRLVPTNQLYEVQKLPSNHEWRKAQAVVLPEGMTWEEWWMQNWACGPDSPEALCERLASTVIQVWREGE